jgi:subtilase family serine protease
MVTWIKLTATLGVLPVLLTLAPQMTAKAGEQMVPLVGFHPVGIDLRNAPEVPLDRQLPLEIFFAIQHRAEFEQRRQQVQSPSSPEYRHWIGQPEWRTRFAESSEEYRAVLQWLRSNGFHITRESYGKAIDSISFTGTVAQAKQTFGVTIVSAGGDSYANTSDPLIPKRFAGLIGSIQGLDNLGAIYIPSWRTRRTE